MDEFLIHSCEQVLRFSRVDRWEALPEKRRVQLGFNLGVMSYALPLTKERGFDSMTALREGMMQMSDFHNHIRAIVGEYGVPISEENVLREL